MEKSRLSPRFSAMTVAPLYATEKDDCNVETTGNTAESFNPLASVVPSMDAQDHIQPYSEEYDDWIIARFKPYDTANESLRIPTSQTFAEFEEKFLNTSRSERSLENRIINTDRLRNHRDQYPRSHSLKKGKDCRESRKPKAT
jgi:hypothetical protein